MLDGMTAFNKREISDARQRGRFARRESKLPRSSHATSYLATALICTLDFSCTSYAATLMPLYSQEEFILAPAITDFYYYGRSLAVPRGPEGALSH